MTDDDIRRVAATRWAEERFAPVPIEPPQSQAMSAEQQTRYDERQRERAEHEKRVREADQRRLDQAFRDGVVANFGPQPKTTIWADRSKAFDVYVDQAMSRYPVGSPGATEQAVTLVLTWVENNEPPDVRGGFVEFVRKALTEYIEARNKAQVKKRG